MIILGIVLLVIGVVAKIAILQTVGIILVVVGAVLWLLGPPAARSADASTTGDPLAQLGVSISTQPERNWALGAPAPRTLGRSSEGG